MEEAQAVLEGLDMHPFTRIMNSVSLHTSGWVNYMSAVAVGRQPCDILHCRPSSFEKWYVDHFFKKHGRFPFYNRQNPLTVRAQILLNGLCGNRENLPFLLKNLFSRIVLKRMILQSIAHVSPDGRLDFCSNCPDITVKDGKVVPVCVCDNMRPRPIGPELTSH